MRLLHKNQKGFTLIELLITVAIVAGIGVVTAAAIGELVQSNRTSNHMVAVRQVQQAGHRVSQDCIQAQSITPGENGGFPLTINWIDRGSGEAHEVVYNLTPPSGGVCELQRQETVVNTTTTVVGPPTVVAQYIYNGTAPPKPTECSWNETERVLTLNVTAKVDLQTASRTYEIKARPSV